MLLAAHVREQVEVGTRAMDPVLALLRRDRSDYELDLAAIEMLQILMAPSASKVQQYQTEAFSALPSLAPMLCVWARARVCVCVRVCVLARVCVRVRVCVPISLWCSEWLSMANSTARLARTL